MSVRILVVDDEKAARDSLVKQLSVIDDFEIIGTADNGRKALCLFEELKPQVIFLDISMPEMDGIETAQNLIAYNDAPVIIFVSGFDKYAIDAFELNAIDYILKPCDEDRLQKTVRKIKDAVNNRDRADEQLQNMLNFIQKRKVKRVSCYERGQKDKYLISPEEIYYVYVENTDTHVVTKDKTLLTDVPLKEVFSTLEDSNFFQSHRSYIVNLDKIEKISPLFSGNYTILLKDIQKSRVPLSRIQAKKLKSIIPF